MTDNNKIQADLTDKWKKGELPAEWYYVKFDTTDNIYITFYAKSERHFNYCGIHIPEDEITEVLAPVPSYNEWKDQVNATRFYADKWFASCSKNAELKELLKECQNMIAFKHEVYEEDALIKEIDEALQ